MEFASWLAGERFSDHPACTHPLLATVARGVNDNLTDAGRQRIVRLISEVVGVNGDDPLVDVTITVRAAAMAITEAPFDQQKALAVGLLRCEAELDAMHDPRTAELIPVIESASGVLPAGDHVGAALRGAPVERWQRLRPCPFAHRPGRRRQPVGGARFRRPVVRAARALHR